MKTKRERRIYPDPRTSHVLNDVVPADWSDWFERQLKAKASDGKNGIEVMHLISNELNAIAQNAVHLAEYIDWRCWTGTDHGHEKAKKRADAKLRKVRKAMGFTVP